MIATEEAIDAVASSINILGRDEAARLVHTVAPHYRNGRLTPIGLLAACRLLYAGFDRYEIGTQAALAREARAILVLGENSRTQTETDQPAA